MEGPAGRRRFDKIGGVDLLPEALDRLVSISPSQRVDGAEDTIQTSPRPSAQHGLPGLDRIPGPTVHTGQELVVHLDQVVQQGFPRFDEVAGDEGIPFRLGKAAQVSGVVAATELAELADDLGIDRARIRAVAQQILDQTKARDVTSDHAGFGILRVVLEAEQAGPRVALRHLDQKIDGRTQAVRQLGRDHVEQPDCSAGNLGADDPLERSRRRKNVSWSPEMRQVAQ